MTYFVTTRCSFSLWFFAVLLGLAPVACIQLGFPIQGNLWPFHFLGAMLVLMTMMVWVSRAHLRLIFLALIGQYEETETSKGEYLSHRTAAIGFLLAFATAATWLVVAGMKFYIAIPLLVILFMIFLALARIVAETGMFFVHTFFQPMHMAKFFAGVGINHQALLNSHLVGTMVSWFYFDSNESHLPYAVNALRVADGTKGIRRRSLLIPIMLVGMVLAYSVSTVSVGRLAYKHGANSFLDGYGRNRATQYLDDSAHFGKEGIDKVQFSPVVQTCIGAGVMALLAIARFRWVRWPLYPIGWLLCTTWAMHAVWMSVFLGWLAKVMILKFDGAQLYNHLKPFFIGLIIGEVSSASVFAIALLIPGFESSVKLLPI